VLGAASAGAPYPDLCLRRPIFHRQMGWLAEHGYEAVTLAAHTIHHLDLTELDASELREEVAGSRAILRREYGVQVDNFCYPAGRFDETVIAAVKEAGYLGATTEIAGYATRDSPYELARFEILGSGGVAAMAADLSSG